MKIILNLQRMFYFCGVKNELRAFPPAFIISARMKNKKMIVSTLLFALGIIATVITNQTVVSVLGIMVAVVGLWMLRKSIVERRSDKRTRQ